MNKFYPDHITKTASGFRVAAVARRLANLIFRKSLTFEWDKTHCKTKAALNYFEVLLIDTTGLMLIGRKTI